MGSIQVGHRAPGKVTRNGNSAADSRTADLCSQKKFAKRDHVERESVEVTSYARDAIASRVGDEGDPLPVLRSWTHEEPQGQNPLGDRRRLARGSCLGSSRSGTEES